MNSLATSAPWARWALLQELVRRDFQSRYGGSALGFLWVFVHPLWLLGVLSFVFAWVLRLRPPGLEEYGYVPFLVCGLVPWLGFQEGVSRSATAITDQAVLVKKMRFPREALVWAVLISAVLQQLIALTVFAAVLTGAGKLPWRAPWLLPLALALEVGMIYLLGMVLSVLTVWFRDLVQVVGMVLSAWFYLTPVVYSLGMVPERLRAWLVLNPLTTVVELHRAAFFGLAATAVSWKAVAGLAALTSLGCVLATRWFRRATPALADEL